MLCDYDDYHVVKLIRSDYIIALYYFNGKGDFKPWEIAKPAKMSTMLLQSQSFPKLMLPPHSLLKNSLRYALNPSKTPTTNLESLSLQNNTTTKLNLQSN